MVRLMTLRVLTIAFLIFAVGSADFVSAAALPVSSDLHRQDLADDDGDGIPNYLDPDDNEDGTADRDSPATPPDPESGDPVDEDPTAGPPTNPVPDVTNVPPAQEASPNAPLVAALPNTGIGSPPNTHHSSWLAVVAIGAASIISMGVANRFQKP